MNITGSRIAANSQAPFEHVSKGNGEESGEKNSNSVIDQLRKQREEVVKQKNALIAKTGQENKPLSSIKEQIKVYDQQIDNINSQIATETAAMAKEAMEEQKGGQSSTNINSAKPKTEEEINNDKMNLVAKLGHSMESVKSIDSIRKQVEGEADVTEIEIELDNSRRSSFIDNVAQTNPEAAEVLQKKGLSIENKEAKLSGLRARIVELSQTLGEEVGEIQQEIEDSRLQDKIQALLEKWNKSEAGGTTENETKKSEGDGIKPSEFLEKAFKAASETTGDFLEQYKAWAKDASEKGLMGDNKTAFMYGKLEQWEEKLKQKSPEEYGAWKQITASVDVFA